MKVHERISCDNLEVVFLDLQFVFRVLSSLFLFLFITKLIIIIAERTGKEFGFGDMIIKYGGKLRQFFRNK